MSKDTLKWKVKHNTNLDYVYDILEVILTDCGVENIPAFLRPTRKFLNDPFLMKNMKEAIEIVHKHLENKDNILVKVDADADGYTSSSALIQFLQTIEPDINIDYILNFEKRHGLTMKDMSRYTKDKYGLIIIPDASMTAEDARVINKNFDADIIVLDHHLTAEENGDYYTNYCTAVNCTDGEYPNPTLSGAGVVQKFIEAYVTTYNCDESLNTYFLDLVSTGIISDSMDLRNLETRYYALEGLKPDNYHNEFLNELELKLEDDLTFGRTITSIGWKFGPLINGVIRYGSEEEQTDLFRAMVGEHEDREYQPRRKSKDDPKPPLEIHSLQKTMARVASNVKSRQDTEVRKFVKELNSTITEKELDKNSVIFVDGTKILEKGTVTGLVANKLASQYFRPVVLMRSKNSTEFGGSMRGYANSPIENTKEFLEKAGVIINGHSEAAGVLFPKAELNNIIAKCNEMLPLDECTTIYTVDWEVDASNLKREHVQSVAENYGVFGNTVPEPTFAIIGLEIPANQIQGFGEHNGFIRFEYKGIPFVKKYCSYTDFDEMTKTDRYILGTNKKKVKLNLICQFELSKFEDRLIPQVRIIDFDSVEISNNSNTDDDFVDETPRKVVNNDGLDLDW